MAQEMGITVQALTRWIGRCEDERVAVRAGRPEVIPAAARWKLRACYLDHYKQWGPRVLREWARSQGLGAWSATTIAAVIADLRDEPREKPPTVRYEIVGSNVMWSEDGTGFKDRGRKKELVVAQDEHARFKVGYELVDGPADEDAVHRNLEAAFARYGAPLVLKHDGGSIFHGRADRGAASQAPGDRAHRSAPLPAVQRQEGTLDARHQELRARHAPAYDSRAKRRCSEKGRRTCIIDLPSHERNRGRVS